MLDSLLAPVAESEVKIQPTLTTIDDNTFVVEPLERGFGVTLGNAVRRVMLSSIPGVAVTHIKVDGVLHEYSTLKGVREDITTICLNIKKLSLSYEGFGRKVLRLVADGPGVVTALDIQADPEVQIMNPELVLCHLEDDAKIDMELYLGRGVGFMPSEKQEGYEDVIGIIPMDSIFSPIIKVNYVVEDTRIGQRTDYDKLTLEVHTDYTLKPFEAVSKAAAILQEHLLLFNAAGPPVIEVQEVEEETNKELEIPVEDLNLSVRSLNCLKRAGIRNVGELIILSEDDIMKLKNFGQKSLDEIREKLEERGLSLQPSTPN